MYELERAVIEAAKAFVLERGLTSVRGRGDTFDRLCDAVDTLNSVQPPFEPSWHKRTAQGTGRKCEFCQADIPTGAAIYIRRWGPHHLNIAKACEDCYTLLTTDAQAEVREVEAGAGGVVSSGSMVVVGEHFPDQERVSLIGGFLPPAGDETPLPPLVEVGHGETPPDNFMTYHGTYNSSFTTEQHACATCGEPATFVIYLQPSGQQWLCGKHFHLDITPRY